MRLIILFLFSYITIFLSYANAQEVPLVWEENLTIPVTSSAYEQTFSLNIDEPNSKFLLDIENGLQKPSVTEVYINGKVIGLYPLVEALTPVTLGKSNSIRIKVKGKSGSVIRARIYSYDGMETLFGPEDLGKTKGNAVNSRKFSAPAAGQYVLRIEGKPLTLLMAAISFIHLNGKDLVAIKDLISVRNGELFKIVELTAENLLEFRLFGQASIKVSILKNLTVPVETPSQGTLAIKNLVPKTSISPNVPLLIGLQNATFSLSPTDFRARLNDQELIGATVSFTSNTEMKIAYAWPDGENEIEIFVKDSQNQWLSLSQKFIVGDNHLRVKLVRADGTLVSDGWVALSTVSEAPLTLNAKAINGIATFSNLPKAIILVTAETDGLTGFTYSNSFDVSEIELVLEDLPVASFQAAMRTAALDAKVFPINETFRANILAPSKVYFKNRITGKYDLSSYYTGKFLRFFQVPAFARTVTVRYRTSLPDPTSPYGPSLMTFSFGLHGADIPHLERHNERISSTAESVTINDTMLIPEGVTSLYFKAYAFTKAGERPVELTIESLSFSGVEIEGFRLSGINSEDLEFISADPTCPPQRENN